MQTTRCGGVTAWRRAAAAAAAYGLDVSAHCAPQLHAHLGAATPNLRHIEWFHDHEHIARLCFAGTLDPSGGTVRPDAGAAGHGLSLQEAEAEQFPTE